MARKNRKPVFCEYAFLKQFGDASASMWALNGTDAGDNWGSIRTYLTKSDLMLDIDCKTFAEEIDATETFRIWKKATEGQLTIKFVNEHPIRDVDSYLYSQEEGIKTSYLLTQKSAICQHFRKSYGVNVLSPDCWTSNETAKDYSFYFRDCGTTIQQDAKIKWSEIFRDSEYHLSHCNSMLIIDNYIENNLNENLFSILGTLLPESLANNIEFHLTIITQCDSGRTIDSYNKEYSKICEFVTKSRPKLKCRIELYVNDGAKVFHDRTIITNNVKIDSGAGFELFKSGGYSQHKTEIRIVHPYLQKFSDSCDSMYSSIIADAHTLIEKIEKGKKRGKHWPNDPTRNRLFDRPQEV